MSRASSLRPLLAAAVAGLFLAAPTAAQAQSATCQEVQKHLGERQSLLQQLGKLKGKDNKMDPRPACGVFTKLVSNGEATLKWMEANKDWCQVPDQAIDGLKQQQASIVKTKGQACEAAAKVATMEKQARQAQQNGGGGGLLGGPGLTGQYKIPQGAL